jgi:phosphoribosylformylglycinamidine synthase II
MSQVFDFSAMSEPDLQALLDQHQITITPAEALHLQHTVLKREPSLAECLLWSLQHSEQSSAKSTRHYVEQLNTSAPNVFHSSNRTAGVVSVAQDQNDLRYGVVMSHQSQSSSRGVAPTIAGAIELAHCRGAEVIAVANSMQFGSVQDANTHCLFEQSVSSIAGVTNPAGIPQITGNCYYDQAVSKQSSVTGLALGIVTEHCLLHSHFSGEVTDVDLILVGNATEGFSADQTQKTNALLSNYLMKVNQAFFDYLDQEHLIEVVAFTALGAGGLGSASMDLLHSTECGLSIDLQAVHASSTTLDPSSMLCAETSERYLWAVPAEISEEILTHYNNTFNLSAVCPGAKASRIGKVTKEKGFQVTWDKQLVVDVSVDDFISESQYQRDITPRESSAEEPEVALPEDFNDVLLNLLSHENIASRECVVESYDKQVQGRTVIEAGRSDAGVLQPFNEKKYPEEIQKIGIALSIDQRPRYAKIDPYWAAVNTAAEVIRNVACVGATPQAMTSSFSLSDPDQPEEMWEFSEAVRGIADVCRAFHLKEEPDACLPVVDVNVSYDRQSDVNAPVVSCLGKLRDVSTSITKDFKTEDACILLVGERKDECGGSVYYQLENEMGKQLPMPDIKELERQVYALTDAVDSGLVLAAHDISKGGLAVALAKMSIKNKIGVLVDVPSALPQDRLLFSETPGFVLEVAKENLDKVEAIFGHYQCSAFYVGTTTNSKRLHVQGCIDLSVVFAAQAYQDGLKEKLT